MVSFHVFGLQECHFRRRKEKKKKKKVGKCIGDPVRGRDAPMIYRVYNYLCSTLSAELLPRRRHPMSTNSGFSETAAWIQAKFCGKLPLHHNSRLFLFFSKFSLFYDFFLFFINMGPYGSKNFKMLPLLQSSSDLGQTFFDKLGSHEGIKSYGIYWRSPKIKKKYGTLKLT